MGCGTSLPLTQQQQQQQQQQQDIEIEKEDIEDEEEEQWDIQETNDVLVYESEGEEVVNEYHLREVLGRGSFGLVRRCLRMDPEKESKKKENDDDESVSHSVFAMKFLSKSKLRRIRERVESDDGAVIWVNGLDRLDTEINIMRNLFHRNVAIIFEVLNSPEENDVMLVTEYMAGGAVMEYDKRKKSYLFSPSAARIMNGKGYSGNKPDTEMVGDSHYDDNSSHINDEVAASFAHDLLCGLSYLHTRGICHRDIKPENLLVHESGSLRISDFGCSIQIDLTANPKGLVKNTAGTMAFWPPEAIVESAFSADDCRPTEDLIDSLPPDSKDLELRYSAFMADVWAAGIAIHCMLYGLFPFSIEESSPAALLKNIAHFTPPELESVGPPYDSRPLTANELWTNLVIPDPSLRITLANAMKMEWMSNEDKRRSQLEECSK